MIVISAQEPKCFKEPFPKLISGPNDSIIVDVIDVSRKTGAIACGGRTADTALIPTSGLHPVIYYYEPDQLKREWVRTAEILGSVVFSLAFNPNGNLISAIIEDLTTS
jgi:hypothetical protein